MLAYFPAIYPDELLYSVLARYHQHTCARSELQTMEALFGRRLVVTNIALPGALDRLAERLPPGRGLHAERILDTLTPWPYYVAFQPPTMRADARARMCQGQVDGLHMELGLAAFRAGRVTRLRFCRACLEEMREHQGEAYWRRVHQLPSVLSCPDHGTALQQSDVRLSECSRYALVVPDDTNCPLTAPHLVSDLSLLPVLQRLTEASAALLRGGRTARTPEGWVAFYRAWMESVGLALSPRRMNLINLGCGLRRHFGAVLSLFPGVMNGERFAGDWPEALVHHRPVARHPLLHLLLEDFLAQRPVVSAPFGAGPWRCRNPLHRRPRTGSVTLKDRHANRGHVVGVFTCACGYVYTRSYCAQTKQIGPPRFQSYGPRFAPALQRCLREHWSLRATARLLALDPATVVRLARSQGIATPWKGSSRKSARSLHDHPVRRTAQSRRAKHPGAMPARKARIDWGQRDRALAERVTRAAAQIRRHRPPVRVTPTRIERQLDGRGWFDKRQAKLPLTSERLRQLTESVEDFQRRRIAWMADEISHEGLARVPWRVMRRAGLTAKHLPMITSVLSRMDGRFGGMS